MRETGPHLPISPRVSEPRCGTQTGVPRQALGQTRHAFGCLAPTLSHTPPPDVGVRTPHRRASQRTLPRHFLPFLRTGAPASDRLRRRGGRGGGAGRRARAAAAQRHGVGERAPAPWWRSIAARDLPRRDSAAWRRCGGPVDAGHRCEHSDWRSRGHVQPSLPSWPLHSRDARKTLHEAVVTVTCSQPRRGGRRPRNRRPDGAGRLVRQRGRRPRRCCGACRQGEAGRLEAAGRGRRRGVGAAESSRAPNGQSNARSVAVHPTDKAKS